jgi:hypothetical protein
MGWDAFSTPADGSLDFDIDVVDKLRSLYAEADDDLMTGSLDELTKRAYIAAADRVRKATGGCDGLLSYGGLDVSRCGRMLERATGRDVYGPPWTPEDTAAIAASADWSFQALVPVEDGWAFESAREFLNTTAALHRGVRFSW